MIDLHGIVGTGFVHGTALGIAALALPLGPTTMCNCHIGGDPVAPFFPKPNVVTLVMEAPTVAPDRRVTFVQPDVTSPACASNGPTLIAAPTISTSLFQIRSASFGTEISPTICVTVDATGRVTAASFATEVAFSHGRRAVLTAARGARFQPGRPGTAALRFAFD